MVSDNPILLIAATVMTMVSLVVSFYIGAEVIGIIRGVITQLSEHSQRPAKHPISRAPHDTGPLDPSVPERIVTPHQDREAIQKLVDHFEEPVEVVSGEEQDWG